MVKNKSSKVETGAEAADILLQHVLAVCPAIIYTTQASGDFECTFVSENIEQILGYTQREMRDDPDFWASHIHPQDQRRVVSEVFRLIPTGGGNLEYRFRHRDGHYRWFQDTFKVGYWADITQRRLAESFQTLYRRALKSTRRWGLRSGSTGLSKRRGMSSIWIDSASF